MVAQCMHPTAAFAAGPGVHGHAIDSRRWMPVSLVAASHDVVSGGVAAQRGQQQSSLSSQAAPTGRHVCGAGRRLFRACPTTRSLPRSGTPGDQRQPSSQADPPLLKAARLALGAAGPPFWSLPAAASPAALVPGTRLRVVTFGGASGSASSRMRLGPPLPPAGRGRAADCMRTGVRPTRMQP